MNRQKVGGVWVDVDDLKECIDLTELFGDLMICPWHDDHHPSLKVYPDHVYCFACGAAADAIGLVEQQYEYTFTEAVQFLQKYKRDVPARRVRVASTTSFETIDEWETQLLTVCADKLQWLFDRGLEDWFLPRLHIGFTGSAYSIPHMVNGVVENVKFRRLTEDVERGLPKYSSPPDGQFRHLYPWDYFRKKHNQAKTLFITEGEFDAMILLQEDIPSLAVPSGVNTPLENWLPFLRQFTHLFLLYDMDEAGEAQAQRLNTKRNKLGQTVVEMLEPAVVQRLRWPESWGKDVTEARGELIPRLKDWLEGERIP